MNNKILQHINSSKKNGKKLLAVLLDPDKFIIEELPNIFDKFNQKIDFIFVGGSSVSPGFTQELVKKIKSYSKLPVILFPGDFSQISPQADAILFLSLLSGDNPEYLIKQQIKSVPSLLASDLEIIPTGYILIDGDNHTSVQKISNTTPIDPANIELALHTAIAGMYMGKHLIYLEAGSGAKNPVPLSLIKKVSENITIPLIVGGGINNKEQLNNAYKNGADLVVIGNAFEKDNAIFDKL
ncbi:MAG: geranylgeranylglyceryl/heptaprenylglyceryl phosphate synthase [Aureibaculum sp.]